MHIFYITTLNCHDCLSTRLLIFKRFHIIYQLWYITCFSRIFPSSLHQPAFYYHIGARDDKSWWHLLLMPLIIDDYTTKCRCCGQKGSRWYNSQYVDTRSVTSAKTRLNRKGAQNQCRTCVVGRIGHYLVVTEGVVQRRGDLFVSRYVTSWLPTAHISLILWIIHRLMPHPVLYCYVGARDNLVWRYWYVMSLIIDGSVMMCRRWEQKSRFCWYNGRYIDTRSISPAET